MERVNIFYTRYLGATWREWETFLLKGVSSENIAERLNFPVSTVNRLFRLKGGRDVYARIVRKRVFIDLFASGVSPKDIYTKTFKYTWISFPHMRDFYEDLFDNTMTFEEIISYDWVPHVEGWIDFYGLIKGTDY